MLSTDKQTDKLTNATKNITSFAKEVFRQKIDAKHPTVLMENQGCSQFEETLPAFELFTEEEILKVIKAVYIKSQ